jgi:hypothetical protein
MLGSDPGHPAKGLSQGIIAGMDLNNQINTQNRAQRLQAQQQSVDNSGDSFNRAVDILGMIPKPVEPKVKSDYTMDGLRYSGETNEVIAGTAGPDGSSGSGGSGRSASPGDVNKALAMKNDTNAISSQLVDLAFSNDLEKAVGPVDPARLIPDAINPFRSGEIAREIERYKNNAALPDIRKLAPVTDTDVDLLKSIQLGQADSQEVWIDKTVNQRIPAAVKVVHDNLLSAGQSVRPAHELAVSSVTKIMRRLGESPNLAG